MNTYEYNFSLEFQVPDDSIPWDDYSPVDFKEYFTDKRTLEETYDVISKGVSILTDKKVVIDNTVRSSEDVTDSIKSKLTLFGMMYGSDWKGFYELKKVEPDNGFLKRFEPPYFDIIDINDEMKTSVDTKWYDNGQKSLKKIIRMVKRKDQLPFGMKMVKRKSKGFSKMENKMDCGYHGMRMDVKDLK